MKITGKIIGLNFNTLQFEVIFQKTVEYPLSPTQSIFTTLHANDFQISVLDTIGTMVLFQEYVDIPAHFIMINACYQLEPVI